MLKVTKYRILYQPRANTGEIYVTLQDGTEKTVPIESAAEFAAAIAVLRHAHVEYHEANDERPGALEARG